MKSARSLMLILSLAAAGSPVTAEERAKTAPVVALDSREPATPDPTANAMTPEAIGLAIAQSEIRTELSPNFSKIGRSVAKAVLIGFAFMALVLGTGVEAGHH
jgi:hypothetical protein